MITKRDFLSDTDFNYFNYPFDVRTYDTQSKEGDKFFLHIMPSLENTTARKLPIAELEFVASKETCNYSWITDHLTKKFRVFKPPSSHNYGFEIVCPESLASIANSNREKFVELIRMVITYCMKYRDPCNSVYFPHPKQYKDYLHLAELFMDWKTSLFRFCEQKYGREGMKTERFFRPPIVEECRQIFEYGEEGNFDWAVTRLDVFDMLAFDGLSEMAVYEIATLIRKTYHGIDKKEVMWIEDSEYKHPFFRKEKK